MLQGKRKNWWSYDLEWQEVMWSSVQGTLDSSTVCTKHQDDRKLERIHEHRRIEVVRCIDENLRGREGAGCHCFYFLWNRKQGQQLKWRWERCWVYEEREQRLNGPLKVWESNWIRETYMVPEQRKGPVWQWDTYIVFFFQPYLLGGGAELIRGGFTV